MQEGVKSRQPAPAPLSEPNSVDGIVRKLTREQEAAAELATGLRELIKDNPLVQSAKRISKAVDTLQVLAGVLLRDFDKGGSAQAKTAFQDHLTQLKTASTRCSSPADFSSEKEMHKVAFVICKHLENTPRLLAGAMSLQFEDLVDLRPEQGAGAVANKQALLQILRSLGQAYCEISIELKVPVVPLQDFTAMRRRVWEWYRRLVPLGLLVGGIWLLNSDAGFFKFLFLMGFGGLGVIVGCAILAMLVVRWLEPILKARYHRQLATLGIHPSREGHYHVAQNGLLLATDYGVLQSMLTARGHDWDKFPG